MSTLTDKLGMSKPEDGDTSWGDEIRGALDTIDSALISFYFGENVAGHSGLDFAYLGGIYRKGNIIVSIAGGTITLADDTTNYVFINTTTGSVVVNQTGVVLGNIALFEVVTASGAITTVVDVRSLLSADVTVPHTHNNLLDETAHDLLDHTGLTGVGSSNVADFTDLGDVPSSLIGLGGQAIIVKEDETGLETATLNTTFVDLTDTPVSYIGQSGKIPAVNEDEDGLEFTSVPPSVNGLPQGGTAGQILEKIDSTDYNAQWVDVNARKILAKSVSVADFTGKDGYILAYDETNDIFYLKAANGIPAGGTANQILAKIDSTNYNAQWIDAPSGGGAIIESRIGNLLPVVPSSGLTEKEAAWQRVVCLNDCSVTKVIFFIYAVIGNVRLKVAEVNSLTGNATIVDTIYTGSYAAPSSPPCVHVIESLAIDLTKDKIYAFILESEIGTTLQVDASNDRAVLGQGSLLPASTNIGGYTTRGSTTLTAYNSSIIPIIIGYE